MQPQRRTVWKTKGLESHRSITNVARNAPSWFCTRIGTQKWPLVRLCSQRAKMRGGILSTFNLTIEALNSRRRFVALHPPRPRFAPSLPFWRGLTYVSSYPPTMGFLFTFLQGLAINEQDRVDLGLSCTDAISMYSSRPGIEGKRVDGFSRYGN